MASLASILNDPNYVNANEATKQAIFEKFASQDPDFTGANTATQDAIRQKFGVMAMPAPAMPGMPQDQMPAPRMSTGQQVLEFVRPTISAVGTTLGGIAGTAAGTPLGPVGMATGGVGGAGLGYAMTEEGLRLVEEALGYRQPVTDPRQLAEQATRNVLEGAAFEAGGRAIVGPVLEAAGRGASRLAGGIADMRQIPQQKAAAAAREAIVGRVEPGVRGQVQMAGEVAEARQALQARPDLLPGQALAEAGQIRPTAQALLQRAGAQAPERTMNMLNAQDTVRLNQLAAIAGGTDQTAARAAREEARDILNKLTTPQRELALSAAGRTTQEMIDLGVQAARAGEEAAQSVQDVRRFTAAGERARGAQVTPVPGQPRVSTQITYFDDLAQAADKKATDAATASLDFGYEARLANAALDELSSRNLKPLTAQSINNKIDQILTDPSRAAGNKPLQDIMNQVKQSIALWTDNNNVINPQALENIRKHVLSSYILNVPAGAEAAEKVAKQSAGMVKGIIDDAIEAAGGTGWRKYLDTYSKASQGISQAELGSQALRLYESAPRTFIKVVEGNDPKLVERIFGPNSYNIVKEMSKDAMGQLKGIAGEVKRDREMATQAKAGQERMVELMKDYGVDLQLPNVFSIVATTGNAILSGLSKRINKRSYERLIEASKDAKSFDELLGTLPASERSKVLQFLRDPSQFAPVLGRVKRAATPVAGGAATAAPEAYTAFQNMLAPEPTDLGTINVNAPRRNMLMAP
jgi:hypothetical protein